MQDGTNLSHLPVVALECKFSMVSLLRVEMIAHVCFQTAAWDIGVDEPSVAATMMDRFVVPELFVLNPVQNANQPHLANSKNIQVALHHQE